MIQYRKGTPQNKKIGSFISNNTALKIVACYNFESKTSAGTVPVLAFYRTAPWESQSHAKTASRHRRFRPTSAWPIAGRVWSSHLGYHPSTPFAHLILIARPRSHEICPRRLGHLAKKRKQGEKKSLIHRTVEFYLSKAIPYRNHALWGTKWSPT